MVNSTLIYYWKVELPMTEFLKTKRGLLNVLAAGVVLVVACAYLLGSCWYDSLTFFHDVTVELGAETLSIAEFMTDSAWGSQVDFVTDYRKVDLGRVGKTDVTLSHAGRQQTVKLTVQDTQAPTADIERSRTVDIDSVPGAEELVTNVQDADTVTIRYAQEPVVSVDYSDVTVEVIVEDGSGNQLRQECVFTYRWFRESLELELGEKLTAGKLLLNPKRDTGLLDEAAMNRVNKGGVGDYEVSATLGDTRLTCAVTVRDTTGPELELKQLSRKPGGYVTMEQFIESVSDLSGDPEVRLVGELPSTLERGKHTVTIEAEDAYGNVTRKETTLLVADDIKAPSIQGATEPISVEKNSEPNFLEGVTAYDLKDGQVKVTVDPGKLDMSSAGIYYITYIAEDSAGNRATQKRKVEVLHDETDTAAMVAQIADSLPDDPELIRDYVRSTIGYTTNWGGDDPVWYGFTKNAGNCYVHALCLQSILDLKGYETQLIWVTNESHYWLLIKLGEDWRHIDATPSTQHARYSLMTDYQRLSTLSGRQWDFSKWPVCE